MNDGRSLRRYLCFLAVEGVACAWAAHGTLPCLTHPHPLLPWHTISGLDWRVDAALLALGLLLPYLAGLLAFQLYLAATAQTARECLRRYMCAFLVTSWHITLCCGLAGVRARFGTCQVERNL